MIFFFFWYIAIHNNFEINFSTQGDTCSEEKKKKKNLMKLINFINYNRDRDT